VVQRRHAKELEYQAYHFVKEEGHFEETWASDEGQADGAED
jgi:hypothetical protein